MTIKIIFAGFGGQGVLMMGFLLATAAMRIGKSVTYLPSYGAEVRGGTANCTVVVSDEEIASPVTSSPDYVVAMNKPSLFKFINIVRIGGTILLNSSLVNLLVNRQDITTIVLPVNDLAHELGEIRSANVIMIGGLVALIDIITINDLKQALHETGLAKKPKILELNYRALEIGNKQIRQIIN